MFPAMISCALLASPADGGRVEVEGVVVTAVIKPTRHSVKKLGGGADCELALTIAAKDGGKTPNCVVVGPIKASGPDNRSLTLPSRLEVDSGRRSSERNNWTIPLYFTAAPGKKVHAVEGTISMTPSERKTVTFEGATLKPNAVIAVERGYVKLTVLDLEDDR